ncbi:MAG: hypothetical protein JWL97_2985 [Gemmatimonadales bacterium]|nr:hypothetical protein [Gemmatimonadales bacterium]
MRAPKKFDIGMAILIFALALQYSLGEPRPGIALIVAFFVLLLYYVIARLVIWGGMYLWRRNKMRGPRVSYDHRISTGALLILTIIMLMILPMFWVKRLLLALAAALLFAGVFAFVVSRQERR